MANKTIVAASILAADFNKLGEEINATKKAGCEWVHFDVMDGLFVNNISFGIPVLKSIAPNITQIKDIHLMIQNPQKYVLDFIQAGADIVTIHYEVLDDTAILELIDLIHLHKRKVGISIKPQTNVEVLTPYLHLVDLVLIMSVEPGFGGQLFDESALPKIEWLRNIFDENGYRAYIEVDGGMNLFTAKMCVNAGADVLVAGSYLFGQDDMKDRVEDLKSHKR